MKKSETKSPIDLTVRAAQIQIQIAQLVFQSDRLKMDGRLAEALESNNLIVEKSKEQKTAIHLLRAADPNCILEWTPDIMHNAMTAICDLHEALGDYARAKSLWLEIETMAKELGDTAKEMDFQRQHAVRLEKLGRFNEALIKLQTVHDYFSTSDDIVKLAEVKADLAELLDWLTDSERSLAYAAEALALIDPLRGRAESSSLDLLLRQTTLNKIYASALQTIGRVKKDAGKYDEARSCFNTVRRLVPQEGMVGIDFQIARLELLRGNIPEGLGLLNDLEREFVGLARQKLGVLKSWQAEGHYQSGDFTSALGLADEALADLNEFGDLDGQWRTLWRKAQVLIKTGDRSMALDECEKAVRILENLRRLPLGYRIDSLYLNDKIPLIHTAIRLAHEFQNAALSSYFMEVAKSRMLTAILSASQETEHDSSDLERRFWYLCKTINEFEFNNRGGKRFDEVVKERDQVFARIRLDDDRWKTLTSFPAFKIEDVQQALIIGNQAALSLFIVADTVYCTLITADKREVSAMKLTADCFSKLREYELNLSAEITYAGLFDFSEAFGIEISQIIAEPLIETALTYQSIIIVPHQNLHILPWSGMLYKGKRMFEYRSVSIVPNLSVIKALHFNCQEKPRIALIGSPEYSDDGLPHLDSADVELTAIADMYGDRVIDELKIGKDATVENFWNLAGHPKSAGALCHLACHGAADTEHAYGASLFFADGKIDTSQLMVSRLKYNEVILSACSTGYRPTKIGNIELVGDDILSIPGALLESGVRWVLVSIPPAADKVTCEFVVTYHRFRATFSPLESIRKTQLEMLKKPEYPIYLWVGFTVYGIR